MTSTVKSQRSRVHQGTKERNLGNDFSQLCTLTMMIRLGCSLTIDLSFLYLTSNVLMGKLTDLFIYVFYNNVNDILFFIFILQVLLLILKLMVIYLTGHKFVLEKT